VTMIPVTLEPTERYRIDGICEGFHVSETVVRMNTRYTGTTRMRVGYFTPDGIGRRTTGGPILPGPYATLIPLAGAESARLREAASRTSGRPSERGREARLSPPGPAGGPHDPPPERRRSTTRPSPPWRTHE
jgi:hypothetical protein